MERKRKNIPAGVRWRVFSRDDFKCIYCGAKRGETNLVIDHGDPFSKGGEDEIDNYVTACQKCNAGKRDSEAIPKAAWVCDEDASDRSVMRRGVRYDNHLQADWGDALRHVSTWVRHGETRRVACICGDEPKSRVTSDFVCQLVAHDYESVHVVIEPLCDVGSLAEEQQRRLRDAAILGYSEPTLLIMGSPWYFYAILVDDRHKGCPSGVAVDESLRPAGREYLSGWYPDEHWEFIDPREVCDIRPNCFDYKAWHMSVAEAAAMHNKGVKNGL